MNCPSCNKQADLVYSSSPSETFYMEHHCHRCRMAFITYVKGLYHPKQSQIIKLYGFGK